MLFTRPGLEQASGELTARHRAGRFASVDGPVVDLCCGIGGDLRALAAVSGHAIGVDRDEVHGVLAQHNARAAGVDADIAVADVRDVRIGSATAVFVDPARRSAAGRRGGSEPSLDWCLQLPAQRLAVKTAPGVETDQVPTGWEAEFVAVNRELREAVLWSPGLATAARRATLLPSGDTLVAGTEELPPLRTPAAYLLDPSPAVTRAGLVRTLAAIVDGAQIDRRIAFLTAEHPMRSPFGRLFRVEASLPFGMKALAAALRHCDIRPAEFRRRGLAGHVEDLRRRLPLGGSRAGIVVLTRVADRPWAIVCTEP